MHAKTMISEKKWEGPSEKNALYIYQIVCTQRRDEDKKIV